MALQYNAPNDTASSIDGVSSEQLQTLYWLRTALEDAKKEQFFTQLADPINMPKHYGKVIKRYQYIPLLDDRNKNDQGIDAAGVAYENGNLYGSSHDVGLITDKLPSITENGGRSNRVGFTRTIRQGTFKNYGMFYEWTEDAMNFDSDSELSQHLAKELVKGANEMQESLLQIDLLNSAGTFLYGGSATSNATVTGEGNSESVLTYKLLQKLDQKLTLARCDRDTKVISGSRMVDTRVIPSARVAYVGPELGLAIQDLKDNNGNPAFIAVEHYASATTPLHGEIGTIGHFRIIQVPEMLYWEGAGAKVVSNTKNYLTGNNSAKEEHYNVYPLLVVGNDSFNTIGFQTDGKSAKFKIMTKEPGMATADRTDPYGKKGFSSLQFWYGFLCNRPEWIGLIKTVVQG